MIFARVWSILSPTAPVIIIFLMPLSPMAYSTASWVSLSSFWGEVEIYLVFWDFSLIFSLTPNFMLSISPITTSGNSPILSAFDAPPSAQTTISSLVKPKRPFILLYVREGSLIKPFATMTAFMGLFRPHFRPSFFLLSFMAPVLFLLVSSFIICIPPCFSLWKNIYLENKKTTAPVWISSSKKMIFFHFSSASII